jgi:hypothetical protein
LFSPCEFELNGDSFMGTLPPHNGTSAQVCSEFVTR